MAALLLFFAPAPSVSLWIDTHFCNMCNFDFRVEEAIQVAQAIARRGEQILCRPRHPFALQAQ